MSSRGICGPLSEAVARAARERSEQERETQPLAARRSLPTRARSKRDVWPSPEALQAVRERADMTSVRLRFLGDPLAVAYRILENLLEDRPGAVKPRPERVL